MTDRKNIQAVTGLAAMQKSMFFSYALDAETEAYVEQFDFIGSGPVDVQRLRDALDATGRHYGVLRTTFSFKNTDSPYQIVLKNRELPLDTLDLSRDPDPEAAVAAFKTGDRARGFDLSADPLFRATLVDVGGDRWHLVLTFHHIILDGWSLGPLFRTWFGYYEELGRGEFVQRHEAHSYDEYISWYERQGDASAREYWSRALEGYERAVGLPRSRESEDYTTGQQSWLLTAEVRERLSALRLNLDDPVEHRVSLDTARRPRHRERRELLARLRFADVGLARQVGGADLVAGTGLGQFIEEWAYAWTPLVEAALVRAAATAPTLEILVLTRLEGHLEGEVGAGDLARLLTETAVMGLGEPVVVRVCDALETALAEVSDLAELTDVLHRLAGLVEGLGRLSLEGAVPRLCLMLGRGTAAAARLVGELVGLEDDEAAGAVDALIAVRDLLARLTRVAGTRDSAGGGASNNVVGNGGVSNSDASGGSHSNGSGHVSNDSAGDVSSGNTSGATAGGGNGVAGGSDVPNGVEAVDVAAWGRDVVLREVDALRRDRATAPVLVGCATGIASSTGSLSRREVAGAIVARLSPEADRTGVADFLVGLMRTSPDVVLHDPDILRAVTRTLSGLGESGFLAVLPDLRRAFTALRPTETHRLAERIAALTGVDAARIDVVRNASPADAALGWRIEQDLVASLVRDGLEQWVGR